MNKRVLTILLTAFVIAAACSYLVYRIVGNRLLLVSQKATPIIVANQDVKLGSVLRDVDLGTAEISGALPKGAIQDRQQADSRKPAGRSRSGWGTGVDHSARNEGVRGEGR